MLRNISLNKTIQWDKNGDKLSSQLLTNIRSIIISCRLFATGEYVLTDFK